MFAGSIATMTRPEKRGFTCPERGKDPKYNECSVADRSLKSWPYSPNLVGLLLLLLPEIL
jgi:hypothetical protein